MEVGQGRSDSEVPPTRRDSSGVRRIPPKTLVAAAPSQLALVTVLIAKEAQVGNQRTPLGRNNPQAPEQTREVAVHTCL